MTEKGAKHLQLSLLYADSSSKSRLGTSSSVLNLAGTTKAERAVVYYMLIFCLLPLGSHLDKPFVELDQLRTVIFSTLSSL